MFGVERGSRTRTRTADLVVGSVEGDELQIMRQLLDDERSGRHS